MAEVSIGSISQRDQAYQALKRLLILQKIPEGQRLREPEWSERLGVNRTALREAFARLEASGLIVRGPTTGYFVPELNEIDIQEIIKIRLILECGAIDLLSAEPENLQPRLKPLSDACDEFESFLKSDYMLGVTEADRRFHESLIEAANSPRLTMLYCRAPLPLINMHVINDKQWRIVSGEVSVEHRAILQALTDQKFSAAKQKLKKHLLERSQIPLYA